jgi:hypothetical protein
MVINSEAMGNYTVFLNFDGNTFIYQLLLKSINEFNFGFKNHLESEEGEYLANYNPSLFKDLIVELNESTEYDLPVRTDSLKNVWCADRANVNNLFLTVLIVKTDTDIDIRDNTIHDTLNRIDV